MLKAIGFIVTMLFIALGFSPVAYAEGESDNSSGKVPRAIGQNGVYLLGACENSAELDCIEDFGVLETFEGQDKFISGSQTSYDPSFRGKGQHGRPIYGGQSNWIVPLAQGAIEMGLAVELMSNKSQIGETKNLVGGGLFAHIHGREEDFETRYFIKIRTSWFKPENFTLHANNAGFSEEKIKGGTLWTFSGSRVTYAAYKFENQEQYRRALESKRPADAQWSDLNFLGHHVMDGKKSFTSFFNNPCSSKGYMVQANNAPGGGMAYWDSESRSLNFSIEAAHKTMDGKLNKGFYRMWVNREYIECMWPQSGLADAKSFAIGVYNEDGTKQVATTLVAMKKDQLTVAAYNFHYSAPSIRLSKARTARVHCVSITDQTSVKKISGKKCPIGFKAFG